MNFGRFEAFATVPAGITISVGNSGGGPTAVSIAAGSYTITSLCVALQSALNTQRPPSGGTWVVAVSTGRTGTGLVTIATGAGVYSITWTSTLLRDLLGFTADIVSVSTLTGTKQPPGLFIPDSPLTVDFDPGMDPKVTDLRSVVGPTGKSIAYSGTSRYEHSNLSYTHISLSRFRETKAVTANASWQSWLKNTQWSSGHVWFSPGSRFQLYWDNAGTDELVGLDMNGGTGPVYGWSFAPALGDLKHVRNSAPPWLGYWAITIQSIVSEG